MTNVLGMDGGGRTTYAVVTDEQGGALGAGEAGASNWEIAGEEGAGSALVAASSEALGAAAVAPDAVASVVLGLAGFDWPPSWGQPAA